MTTSHITTNVETVARFNSSGLPVRIDRRTVESHTGTARIVRDHYRAEVGGEDWRLSVPGDAPLDAAIAAAVEIARHTAAEIAQAEAAATPG